MIDRAGGDEIGQLVKLVWASWQWHSGAYLFYSVASSWDNNIK
jgi:hypothetical protein